MHARLTETERAQEKPKGHVILSACVAAASTTHDGRSDTTTMFHRGIEFF